MIKKTSITGIVLFLFVFYSLSVFCQLSHTVTFSLSDLSFEKRNGYDVVNMKGLSSNGEAGSPLLPGKGVNLIIPSNMDVASISVTQKEVHTIGGKFNILPKQANSAPDQNSTVFTQPDPKIYNSDMPYPAEIAKFSGAGYFDGANRIAAINIIPFQYNPVSGELSLITNITFTLNLKETKDKPIIVKERTKRIQAIYDRALHSLVDNKEDIITYGKKPIVILEDSVVKPGVYYYGFPKKEPLKQGKKLPTYEIPDAQIYIFTTEALMGYFNNYCSYKVGQGYALCVANISYLYSQYPNGDIVSGINDNAGKLRQHLINCYTYGAAYVILGGDQTIVPVRYGWCNVQYNNADHWGPVPADLYYSDLNGDWEVDGDAYYGELYGDSPDFYPEMYVGRLPFTNGQDILNWTSKVVQYEQNPFNGNRAAVTRVLWVCADAVRNHPDWVAPSFPGNFSNVFIKEQPFTYDSTVLYPTSPTGKNVIDTLSQGFGFFNIYTHGAPTNFAVRTSGENEYSPQLKYGVFSYDIYDEDQGQNPYYVQEAGNGFDNMSTSSTIIYSTACDVAKFDSTTPVGRDCMAKAYLRLPNAGGPAFIGNTRAGVDWSNGHLHQKFLLEVFDTNAHIGVAYALSKPDFYWNNNLGYDGHWTIYSQNLFGDPSMTIWTSTPPSSKIIANYQDKMYYENKEMNESQPKCFNLYPNYPNPFNPSTTISFDLPEAGRVNLLIYDILGREVASLVNEEKTAGHYSVNWNAQKMTSGIYFCKIIAGNFVQIRQMMLMK